MRGSPELNLTDFMQEEEIVVPTFWFATVSSFFIFSLVQFLQGSQKAHWLFPNRVVREIERVTV